MLVPVALALAGAVSPLGVEVSTPDGHRRFIPVADADATPVEVCAGAVCAPVTTQDGRLVANLDVAGGDDVTLVVRSHRSELRSASPGAVAVGLGLAAVGLGAGAAGLSTLSMALPPDADGTSTSTPAQTGAVSGQVAVGLWVGAGAAAVGAVALGVIAAVGE